MLYLKSKESKVHSKLSALNLKILITFRILAPAVQLTSLPPVAI